MNIKTTLILMVLVGGLLGVWAIFLRGGPGEVHPALTGGPFFSNFLASDANEVRIEDAGGHRVKDAVTFTRGAGGWQVSSASLEGGRPVPAKARVVEEVLEVVQALKPLRLVVEDPDANEEQELGLGVRDCLTITVSGPTMNPVSLALGSEVGPGEVTCRASARPEVFAVPQEVLRSLAPEARDAEDPALLRLDVLDVKTIEVERAGERVLSLDRGHARWFMEAPIAGAPADGEHCDRLRQAVLSLAIQARLWDQGPMEELTDPPAWRIVVGTASGESHVVRFGRIRGNGGIVAGLDDKLPLVVVSDHIVPLLQGDLARYRDRRPLDIPNSRIASVRVERQDDSALMLQRHNQQVFRITLPGRTMPNVTLFADEVDTGEFLSSLGAVQFVRFAIEEPAFEPALEVVVSVTAPGGQVRAEQRIKIGSSSEGERPLRVVGQPGTGWVKDEAVAFLGRPYWSLLERRAKCTDAYFKVGRMEVTNAEGKATRYTGRIPGLQQDLVLSRDVNGVRVAMKPDIQRRLLTAMTGGVAVESWIGEGARPEMGFERPHLLVRWFEPEGATNSGIPQTDEGEWKALIIGNRQANGTYYAMIEDGKLDLTFILDPINLPIFTDLQ
ncbi:MAG: DUF4340 domain-containing protein [Planctomycetes bacterium]|nr:DUF4340 domain-containing protein [Planctomycetota bacterium]